MWMQEALPEGLPTWQPDEVAPTAQLRIAGSGLMEYLDQVFNAAAIDDYWRLEEATATPDPEPTGDKKADRAAKNAAKEVRDAAKTKMAKTYSDSKVPPRLWPDQSLWHGYSRPAEVQKADASGTVFNSALLVLQLTRRKSSYRALDAATTLAVTRQLRDALNGLCKELGTDAPELLTGHRVDRSATEQPHLAFLPLLFTGHTHADGRLMGVALAFPDKTNPDDRRTILRALAELGKNGLVLGRLGEWEISRPKAQAPHFSPTVGLALPLGGRNGPPLPHLSSTNMRRPKTSEPIVRKPPPRSDLHASAWACECPCESLLHPPRRTSGFHRLTHFRGFSAKTAPSAAIATRSLNSTNQSSAHSSSEPGVTLAMGCAVPSIPKSRLRAFMTAADFPDFFKALWGFDPFPWQTMLAQRVVVGKWPRVLSLPTAAGKNRVPRHRRFCSRARG